MSQKMWINGECAVCEFKDKVHFRKPTPCSESTAVWACTNCKCKFILKFRLQKGNHGRVETGYRITELSKVGELILQKKKWMEEDRKAKEAKSGKTSESLPPVQREDHSSGPRS